MLNKPKLLIIGKHSFIANNLYLYLKNKIYVQKISYEKTQKLNNNFLCKFDYICNCSIKKEYVNKKYLVKNDLDSHLINKLKKLKITYIFLSSRKIYKPKANIKETDKVRPIDNYSKNKLISEKKVRKLFKNKYLILRISNLIGKNKKTNRKVSNNFIDNYFKFRKKKNIYYENYFKDFLSIDQFNVIFFNIIKNNLKGIYNVSLGKKVYIDEILKSLNKSKNRNKFKKKKIMTDDSFYLNNKKLLKKIKIKIKKSDLLDYCYKM